MDSSQRGAPDAFPELTVSIHAYNSARFIRKAIASVLDQDGVQLEVIIVDDASTDNTSMVVSSLQDPRVKLLKNGQTRGPAHCHNLAIKLSQAPFIAQVGAEDLVLPGGLRKLLQLCRSAPRIGMVHCYSFEIDENGETTREAFRLRRELVLRNTPSSLDYKRVLLSGNDVIDSVRLYNREALNRVGTIKPKLNSQANHDLALRISEEFEIKLLPEFLYCRRILDRHDHTIKRRNKLSGGGLGAVRPSPASYFISQVKRAVKHALGLLFWKVCMPIVNAVYYSIFPRLSWWPIGSAFSRSQPKPERRKIAYYIWHFPVLSQTFVNRELAALKQSGLTIEIIADGSEDIEIADENAKSLLENTHYLNPLQRGLLRKYGRPFFRENPLLFLNLLFFVLTRRHTEHKSLDDDLYLFAKATHLAQFLRNQKIDHIHAPWADQTAYVALLAAKLLGITYSVQARAHDIHRKSYLHVLREKFENAEFVITNTRYNQLYIESLVAESQREKIEVVYNGIDLEKFRPRREAAKHSTPIRLLCVARLIEQKGLLYLLEALSLLKEKGFQFRCEIIGGREEPLYTDYLIQVRKLHRRLGLEDCVDFLGAQPFKAVMEKYDAADIFVLPCVIAEDGSRDITPNSLIEAMAMKLPVISTDVTGIPETVEDGISGILVPPHEVNALAEAMIKLIQDTELRTQLGEAARRRVEERFDIRRNIEKRLDLFEKVLGSR